VNSAEAVQAIECVCSGIVRWVGESRVTRHDPISIWEIDMGYRYGIWADDMGDRNIDMVILEIDVSYLVTLSARAVTHGVPVVTQRGETQRQAAPPVQHCLLHPTHLRPRTMDGCGFQGLGCRI
jgi:hypothetical protein